MPGRANQCKQYRTLQNNRRIFYHKSMENVQGQPNKKEKNYFEEKYGNRKNVTEKPNG